MSGSLQPVLDVASNRYLMCLYIHSNDFQQLALVLWHITSISRLVVCHILPPCIIEARFNGIPFQPRRDKI